MTTTDRHNHHVDILVVDYNPTGFNRYARPLALILQNRLPNINIVGCYMRDCKAVEIGGFNNVYPFKRYAYRAAKALQELRPRLLITMAHRFFDYDFTICAHGLGIPVLNLQHGLYMPNTVISDASIRSLGQVLRSKRKKISLYGRCIYEMCSDNWCNTLAFFYDIKKQKSMYKAINLKFGDISNADLSLVFGKYYIDYYRKQYYETKTNFEIIGYPELEGPTKRAISDGFRKPDRAVICYLAQTAIEDGTVSPKLFGAFIDQLSEVTNQANLILKLHPRSNGSFYERLIEQCEGDVVVWDSEEFPVADAYIGHESTVLARALTITNRVLVYRLGRTSPFEKFTSYVVTDQNDLKSITSKMLAAESSTSKNSVEEIAQRNSGNGALEQAADKVEYFLTFD